MTSLVIALAIVAVVGIVASILRRRQVSDAPTQKTWTVPSQIDPADLAIGERPWNIVVFTSSSCHVCGDVARKSAVLSSPRVGVFEVEYSSRRDLHDKYRIDAVPTLVVTDDRGVVRHHVLGPISATDLWAAVASVRDPSLARPGDGCADH